MRSAGVLLLVSAWLAGCTSSGSIDDLLPRPSNEVTSSIEKADAPMPAEDVASDIGEEPLPEERVVPVARTSEGERIELPAETVGQLPAETGRPSFLEALRRKTVIK